MTELTAARRMNLQLVRELKSVRPTLLRQEQQISALRKALVEAGNDLVARGETLLKMGRTK